MEEPRWDEGVRFLLGLDQVPAAKASGRLLTAARDRWQGRVVARTSMHDLLFTVPGEIHPFRTSVRVSWSDEVFEFQLLMGGGRIVAGDRSREANALAVLDAFLSQLVED